MPDLTTKAQYWSGVAGGALVVFGHIMALQIADNQPWPDFARFSTYFHVAKWILFPFAAGVASRLCEPRHILAGAYEGASLLGLFYIVARHLPFISSP